MACDIYSGVTRARWLWPGGAAEVGLVELVGADGLGGELGHLLDARSVEVTAGVTLLPQASRLLSAIAAGAAPGLE